MLKLLDNEVHIWSYSLDPEAVNIALYQILLSPKEVIQKNKYITQTLKDKYTISRGGLRRILSKYLSISSEIIDFSYSNFGKPSIVSSQNAENVFFNLSHSNNLALCIVSSLPDIGVDVELRKPILNVLDVAKLVCTEEEYQILLDDGEKNLQKNFYRIWTRKEALVKALGVGLSCSLDCLSVTFLENASPKLLKLNWRGENPVRWHLGDLDIKENYTAAYAIKVSEFQDIKITLKELHSV
jgi:4'-phosphopantetheinyl transferase